ncbi:hypothetical protein ACKFKF_13495 [Phormidesmis sp. 146-12]
MKVRKMFVFPAALLVASLSAIICQKALSEKAYGVTFLSGSGPVFSDSLRPGNRVVRVDISNHNNLNVGYDLIDQGDKTVVANGTIKDQGTVSKTATTLARRTYKLRLRCQEPRWNNTKCSASGNVNW